MSRQRRTVDFGAQDSGAVTIEFVVTLPLFLAALAFAFEFGNIFVAHQATVNNVRAASRYLSRSDMSASDITKATNMVRNGRLAGGTTPNYLTSINATVSMPAAASVQSGDVFEVRTRVDYPLSIFSLAGDNRATIPFVVVEDLRFVGS
ncbi:MAG: TadE/TadG family type IV pilus assembly protein [Hyphomonadaceae bacterium]|nr:TadE/TadG family type IV pilus assembly protein [Hyphomonadaceae bacterium]